MKHIDRNSIPLPAFYKTSIYRNLREDLRSQAKSTSVAKGQSRMKIQYAKVDRALAEPLFELFNSKCAYCEQPLTLSAKQKGTQWVVDRFRPISLYPWLAYSWGNLYLSCAECNISNGQEFLLVMPENRAQDISGLKDEVPQLLDPCSDGDNPEKDLRYKRDSKGKRILLTPSSNGNFFKAEATINIINLNRPSLVEFRWRHWQSLRKSFPFVYGKASPDLKLLESLSPIQVEELIGMSVPFAGMQRQMFCEAFVRKVGVLTKSSIPLRLSQFLQPEFDIERSMKRLEELPDSSLHVAASEEKVKESIKHASIKSVSVTNFKAISSLTFEPIQVPEEEILEKEDHATIDRLMGWTTLIGENGSGKSSILQAITLALAGKKILHNSQLDPSRFLTRGKRSGKIAITLSSGEKISLKITKAKFTFEEGGDPTGIFVRAYGSTRLLPNDSGNGGSGPTVSFSRVEYKNMFDPFVPLIDAGAWLDSLEKSDFVPARLAIKDLLGLRDEQEVERRKGEIEVDGQPLENLSSGYQTLVALACDVMAGVPEGINDMRYAQGIVLLDEIGAHLHPAWKMRIVARLRKAFPLMQFFTSTHEPLCLRGHSIGEVIVVKRDFDGDRKVSIENDLPSPKSMRVDQLLTSEHFGMDSTIDPSIDDSFSEYYQLLADKGIKEGSDHATRRDKLGHELQGYGILGYTRRDQLVYKLIDEYLAEERVERISQIGSPARWEEVKKRVADLWHFAEAFERKKDL